MTVLFAAKAIGVLVALVAGAVGLGKFLGSRGATRLAEAQKRTADLIAEVQADAKKGDDAAVLGDFQKALGQDKVHEPQHVEPGQEKK